MKCLVCGADNASRHFGSICCWACKGFFHRNGRTEESFKCAKSGTCEITKETRTGCRACRLRKCIDAGLNSKFLRGVNPKRSVRAARDVDTTLPDCESAGASCSVASSQTTFCVGTSADYRATASDTAQIIQSPSIKKDLDELPLGVKNLLHSCDHSNLDAFLLHFASVEKLCDNYSDGPGSEAVFSIDVPASTAFHRPGVLCRRNPLDWEPVRIATTSSLRRSYARVVLHVIDWTSFIPELAALEARDKELLLASRIVPCLWLLMGHRSAVYKTKGVAICGGEYHPSRASERVNPELSPVWHIVDRAMAELIDPLSSLDINDAEYAILKLLCFCVEVPGMSREAAHIVTNMRNKCLSLLSSVIQKSVGKADFSGAIARINHLLLLLPAIERVSRVYNSGLALMSMFNYAGLQGQLTWELHMKQNYG